MDVLLVWSPPHGAEPPCAQVAEWSWAGYHRQVRDKHQPLSLCDTVSGCHDQIADGSSLQVSTRVQPEAEAESNLISETMTWLCARARPRACTEHNPWTAAGITQAHITVRCGAVQGVFASGCLHNDASHSTPPPKKKSALGRFMLMHFLVVQIWFRISCGAPED